MPQAVVAAAAYYAAASVAVKAAIIIAGTVIASMVAKAAARMLTPDIDTASAAAKDQTLSTTGTPNARMIVGEAVVSGNIIKYAKVRANNKDYHHFFVPLATHRCESVEPYQLDGKAMNTFDGQGYYIEPRLGDQISSLERARNSMPNVGLSFIGYNVTDLYCEFEINPDLFPNGLQDLKVKVKGHKFYDPRKDSTVGGSGAHRLNDESTWEWTDNPALILFWWKFFGDSIPLDIESFSMDNIAAQANICDEMVDYIDKDGVTRQQKRYTCNGTIDLTTSHEQVEDKLLESCGGRWIESGAQFRLYVAAYQGPATLTINDDDLAGEPQRRPTVALSDRCNTVKCTYISKNHFYQSTDMKPLVSTFLKNDRDEGREYQHDLQLLYTNNDPMAQRLCNIHLLRNAAGDVLQLKVKSKGLRCQPGKVINIQLTKRGITGTYEVDATRYDFGSNTYEITLIETSPDIYNQGTTPAEQDVTPNDVIDNTTVDDVTNASFSQTLVSYRVGFLSWSHPVPSSITNYEIRITSPDGTEQYGPTLNGRSAHVDIIGLNEGAYQALIVAENGFGKRSSEVSLAFNVTEVYQSVSSNFLFGPNPPENSLGENGQRYMTIPGGVVYIKQNDVWVEDGNLASGDGDRWLSGTTDPNNTLGTDGDWYIRLPQYNVWQKVDGAWVARGAIMGAQGPATYTWIKYAKKAYVKKMDVQIPPQTNISGSHIETYNNTAGTIPAVLMVLILDAEGGIRVGHNNSELGSASGQNNEERYYQYPITLTPGNNTFHLWAVNTDGARLKEVVVVTNIADAPLSKGMLGMAFNKTTATASNNLSDYTWSKNEGEDGLTITSVTKSGETVTITYSDGTTDDFTVADGQNAQPLEVVSVVKDGLETTIELSDGSSFVIDDGQAGNGIDTITKDGETVTVVFDDGSTDTFTVADGQDGAPGKDGINADAIVSVKNQRWGFAGSAHGWQERPGSTLTQNPTSITLNVVSNGDTGIVLDNLGTVPNSQPINGSKYFAIRVRIRTLSASHSTNAEFYYRTSSHSFSGSFVKSINVEYVQNEWTYLVFDMRELNDPNNTDDWITSTIKGLRLDFANANSLGKQYEIDGIIVGEYSAGELNPTGQAINLLDPRYQNPLTTIPMAGRNDLNSNIIKDDLSENPPSGGNYYNFKVTGTDNDASVLLSPSTSEFNIRIPPAKKFLISYYAKRESGANGNVQLYFRFLFQGSTGFRGSGNGLTIASAEWQRYFSIIDLSDRSTVTQVQLRFDNDGNQGSSIFVDNIMIEVLEDDLNPIPSPYTPPFDQRPVFNFERMLMNLNAGVGSALSSNPLSAADVGSTTTISVAAHSLQFPGRAVSYNAGSIAGLNFSTRYYVYVDDPYYIGGSVTYQVATAAQITNISSTVGRRYLGSITTPSNGGQPTEPPPDDCPHIDMWLTDTLQVKDVKVGDVLDGVQFGIRQKAKVTAVKDAVEDCVKLTTESGASVIVSTSTPIDRKNTTSFMAINALKEYVQVEYESKLVWEQVIDVEFIQNQQVKHISLDNISFLSGTLRNKRIVTHNTTIKP